MPAFDITYFAQQMQRLQPEIFFVQIGAMDGKTHDPIHKLVTTNAWHGILVEPIKEHFATLQQNYAGCNGLIFENAAIADHTGSTTMYRVPTQTAQAQNLPRWTLQASSLFNNRNALAWEEIKPHVIEETVDCLKFSDLMAKHRVRKIDLLQLDAEGYDFQILSRFSFEKFKPYIINIEIVNMTASELAQCKQILDNHDYLYGKTGYNLLAISPTLYRH